MQDNKFWFFGSKLNTALLLILIVLMVLALRIMTKNKETYFPVDSDDETELVNPDTKPDTSTGPSILGNKDDLVSFSILPGSTVEGVKSYRGVIKGAYFFEANIQINILDANKKVLKQSYATATTDWMTVEPVSFEGNIDFTGLKKGPAYFEIHNDNASGLPENDKSVLVPIVIQ